MELDGIKVQTFKIDKKQPIKNNQNVEFVPVQQDIQNYEGQYTPQMFGILPNFKLSKTLNQPVSFKGNVLKKSDFKGIDLAVIERYKPNIQQFKSKYDLQTFAESKVNELKEKDFGGRQEETKVQRKAMLKEWFDYVIKENDAYSNTQRLVILSAITKDLKPNNDTIPPVLNKGVLADTISELETRLKNNPKENFDFHKMYKNNLRTSMMEDTSTGETMTGWVVIPSKENDPENFEKNVEKLKTLSHNNWCTKSFNAEPYLSQGDFHVYLENGEPKLGVRFVGDKVQEIQGEKNNGKIPQKYFDVFEKHKNDNDILLSESAQDEVYDAEVIRDKIKQFEKRFGENLKIKNVNDAKKIFDFFNIPSRIVDDKLVLRNYDPGLNEHLCFSDFDIDENVLFKYISQIQGNANFSNSEVTDLGNLESITGKASFCGSKITSLGKLKYIGRYANFEGSKIQSLGNLERINGDAVFQYSQVTDLGNLREIGYNANFQDSQIESLKNLEKIGNNAYFSNSVITDLGELEIIKGNAKFSNSKITSLNKLLKIGGNADFSYSDIEDLGELEHIGYFADFSNSKIKDLSRLKYVGGNVDLRYSQVNKICDLENIMGQIECDEYTEDLITNWEDEKIWDFYENGFESNKQEDDEYDFQDSEDYWQMLEQGKNFKY